LDFLDEWTGHRLRRGNGISKKYTWMSGRRMDGRAMDGILSHSKRTGIGVRDSGRVYHDSISGPFYIHDPKHCYDSGTSSHTPLARHDDCWYDEGLSLLMLYRRGIVIMASFLFSPSQSCYSEKRQKSERKQDTSTDAMRVCCLISHPARSSLDTPPSQRSMERHKPGDGYELRPQAPAAIRPALLLMLGLRPAADPFPDRPKQP
jgi:hypothetical protein